MFQGDMSHCLPSMHPICDGLFFGGGGFFVLQLSLDLYYTEDEIYELSYAREPKNCKAPVSDANRDALS